MTKAIHSIAPAVIVAGALVILATIILFKPVYPVFGAGPITTVIGAATTSTAINVGGSTRVLATTTNINDPANSYNRVYASICNYTPRPVVLALNNDKQATASSSLAIIATATGYQSCYEITDRNQYNGSVQASSTAVTSNVTVVEYVQ